MTGVHRTGCFWSRSVIGATLALAFVAAPSESQVHASAESALEVCRSAGDAGDRNAMEAAAEAVLAEASDRRAAQPADALELRARVLSECRLPFAAPIRQGSLIHEANELLERALDLDPQHRGARFALAMNHLHAPAFLGRRDDAMRELERLLADHPAGRDRRLALAHLRLGELYEQEGRSAEAAEIWGRGAARFPDFAPLQEQEPGTQRLAGYHLDPIVVEAGGYSMGDPRTATRLERTEVYTMPGGTADVLQAFQAMPGATRVSEGSDLYVRGGDPAETPVYVDGARLLHPGRFETLTGSLFGVLDPSVMRRAYFSSGGFSARYGNALSGVVDLETDGRPEQARWRGGLNLASLGASVWRPLGDRAGAWGSANLTHTDAMLWLHGRSDDYPSPPRSFQTMAGVAAEPRGGLEFRATALAEEDRTTARVSSHGHDGEFRSRSATRLATARARWISGDGRSLLRLTLSGSGRDSGFRFGVMDRSREDRSMGTGLDGTLDRGRLQLRGGLESTRLESLVDGILPAGPVLAPGAPTVVLEEEGASAHHVGAYGELEARASDRMALIGGVRLDRLPGEDRWSADPRLAVAYRLDDWTLRLGAGRFGQGRWRIPGDVPDAASPSGVPIRTHHLVAGVQRHGTVSLRVEGHHKRYGRYVESEGNAGAIGGRASGVDLLARITGSGRVTGWLTWSLLYARTDLADGRRVPSAHDIRHTATAVARVALGDAWEVGLTGRHASGRPFTPVVGGEPTGEGPPAPIHGEVHSERMPRYLRLDGRLTRTIPLGDGALVAYVEGLNLLDRQNVMAYTYDDEYQSRRPVRSFFGERTLVLGLEARF